MMNASNSIKLIRGNQMGEFEVAQLDVKRVQEGLPQHLLGTILVFATIQKMELLFWA